MDDKTPNYMIHTCLQKGCSWAAVSSLEGITARIGVEQGHLFREQMHHEQMTVSVVFDHRLGTSGVTTTQPGSSVEDLIEMAMRAASFNPRRPTWPPGNPSEPLAKKELQPISEAPIDEWTDWLMAEEQQIRQAFDCDLYGLVIGLESWNMTFCDANRHGQYGSRSTSITGLAQPKKSALGATPTPFHYQGIEPGVSLVPLLAHQRFSERLRYHAATEMLALPGQVKLSAFATAQLVSFVAQAFNGEIILRQISFLKPQDLGRPIWCATISLTDEPLADGAPRQLWFDAEGTPGRPRYLIRAGVFCGALCNQIVEQSGNLGTAGNAYYCSPEYTIGIAPSNLRLIINDDCCTNEPDACIEEFGGQTILDIASGTLNGTAHGYVTQSSARHPVVFPVRTSINRLLADIRPASLPEWHGAISAPAVMAWLK